MNSENHWVVVTKKKKKKKRKKEKKETIGCRTFAKIYKIY